MTAAERRAFRLRHEGGGAGDELRALVRAALRSGLAAGALVPRRRAGAVVPVLVRDAAEIGEDAVFAGPLMPQNAAKLLEELTFRPPSGRIVAVLRSCEYRALVEAAKLKQADLGALLVIGVDCLGAGGPGAPGAPGVPASDAAALVAWRERLAAGDVVPRSAVGVAAVGVAAGRDRAACAICVHPAVSGPSVTFGLLGVPAASGALLVLEAPAAQAPAAQATAGQVPAAQGAPAGGAGDDAAALLAALREEPGLTVGEAGDVAATVAASARDQALGKAVAARVEAREAAIRSWRERVGTFAGLAEALAPCVRCLNCRRACPLCYCRECTFETALFERGGQRYLSRAARKGALRLPAETMLYHLTRLCHVGLSCVSCGMCESYCPAGVELTVMFAALGGEARKLFDYEPGRSATEPLPLATFREHELAPR